MFLPGERPVRNSRKLVAGSDKRIKPFTKAEAEGRGIHPDHWTRLGVVDA